MREGGSDRKKKGKQKKANVEEGFEEEMSGLLQARQHPTGIILLVFVMH